MRLIVTVILATIAVTALINFFKLRGQYDQLCQQNSRFTEQVALDEMALALNAYTVSANTIPTSIARDGPPPMFGTGDTYPFRDYTTFWPQVILTTVTSWTPEQYDYQYAGRGYLLAVAKTPGTSFTADGRGAFPTKNDPALTAELRLGTTMHRRNHK